jgi:hypothetical protein
VVFNKYYSVIKSRRMRVAGHVARMEDKRGALTVLVGKLEIDNSEDLGVDGKIIFKKILNESDGGAET